MSSMNESGFYRLPQVLEIFPIKKSTWFAGVKAGKYPKPVKLGSRISLWKRRDIEDLIKSISLEEGKSYRGEKNV